MLEVIAILHVAFSMSVISDLMISFYMQNSTYCSGACNADLQELGRKCQRAVLPSLVYEIVNNGGDIHECEWLEHLMRVQDLEEKRSQLAEAEGPFSCCKT